MSEKGGRPVKEISLRQNGTSYRLWIRGEYVGSLPGWKLIKGLKELYASEGVVVQDRFSSGGGF